jgi:hypothetical protein
MGLVLTLGIVIGGFFVAVVLQKLVHRLGIKKAERGSRSERALLKHDLLLPWRITKKAARFLKRAYKGAASVGSMIGKGLERIHESNLFAQEKEAVVAAGELDVSSHLKAVEDKTLSDEKGELHMAEFVARSERALNALDPKDVPKVGLAYLKRLASYLDSFMKRVVEDKEGEFLALKKVLVISEKANGTMEHAEAEGIKIEKYSEHIDRLMKRFEKGDFHDLKRAISLRIKDLKKAKDGEHEKLLKEFEEMVSRINDLKALEIKVLRKMREDMVAQEAEMREMEAKLKDAKTGFHYALGTEKELDADLKKMHSVAKGFVQEDSLLALAEVVEKSSKAFFNLLRGVYRKVSELYLKQISPALDKSIEVCKTGLELEQQSKHFAKLLMRLDQASYQLEKMWEAVESDNPKAVHGFEKLEKIEAAEFKVAKLEKKEAAYLEHAFGKAINDLRVVQKESIGNGEFALKEESYYARISKNLLKTLEHVVSLLDKRDQETVDRMKTAESKAEGKLNSAFRQGQFAH